MVFGAKAWTAALPQQDKEGTGTHRRRERAGIEAKEVREVATVHSMSTGGNAAPLGLPKYFTQIHDWHRTRLDGRVQQVAGPNRRQLVDITCMDEFSRHSFRLLARSNSVHHHTPYRINLLRACGGDGDTQVCTDQLTSAKLPYRKHGTAGKTPA